MERITETITLKFDNAEQQRRFHARLEGKTDMDCKDCSQLIGERDHAEDLADLIVNALERLFDQDFGEHSNLNCPWHNAYEFLEAKNAEAEKSN
jgi:hypothetical protein